MNAFTQGGVMLASDPAIQPVVTEPMNIPMLPGPEHEARMLRARAIARQMCIDEGINPDRRISKQNHYPEHMEFFGPALEMAEIERLTILAKG